MNYFPEYVQIALQEIPSEISIVIPLSGCSRSCFHCHSPWFQDKHNGTFMLLEDLNQICEKYKGKASCILFFNGEYDTERLLRMTKICNLFSFKVALYSGWELDELDVSLVESLDYLKTGCYIEELGGLSEKTTNQRMLKKVDGEFVNITKEFWR